MIYKRVVGSLYQRQVKQIDARYIFGQESSVSKNDLAFSIGSYYENDIEIKKVEGDGNGGGCLIATAAFGSELSPQVQFLREIRDNTVLQTESGTSIHDRIQPVLLFVQSSNS